MLQKLFSIVVLSLALVALAMPAARPGLAAPSSVTFTVNSTLDQVDVTVGDGICDTAGGTCTLRAAIMEADKASGLGVTITVPSGIYLLTIPADLTDTANNGDLNLTTPTSGDPLISIVGADASTTIIDANQIDRVLTVDKYRTAVMSGLTLRGGFITNNVGAAISNSGTLTVDHSTLSNNQSAGFDVAGGISNNKDGQLTVIDSTIGPNNTAFVGGGIYNEGTLTVDRSTVFSNSASYGGGIFNQTSANLKLINSTLSQNSVAIEGGAIDNQNIADVYNSTIVFNGADPTSNSSSAAGGVFNDSAGTFNLRNTLLAGNYASNVRSPADCSGTVNSYGRNLIGTTSTPCTVTTPAGGTWANVNSLDFIGPLEDNGGPTWTRALLTGSNAIDWADPLLGCLGPISVLTTDQRGFPRVVGPSCDIGAFEYLPPAAYLPIILH